MDQQTWTAVDQYVEQVVGTSDAALVEVGTLGGYSAIRFGRAVAPDGRVVKLELSEEHAAVGRENLAVAGLTDVVGVVVGRAVETLARMQDDSDLVVVDNVVRGGAVIDLDGDANVQDVRRLNDLLRSGPRLSGTTVQTVGSKGYDGFTLALVVEP